MLLLQFALLLTTPQSFFEADLILDRLSAQDDKGTSFHVVVPSLPGYGLSGPPPRQGWTLQDTARVFDTLMTEVLGYKSYAAQGGDWGYAVRFLDTRLLAFQRPSILLAR